jgi:hypothetical protein
MLTASLTSLAPAQKRDSKPADQVDDVVRVNTDLVQSDVTVVDRQGRFVEGLRADQFELRIEFLSQAKSPSMGYQPGVTCCKY